MFYLTANEGCPAFAGNPEVMNHRIYEFDGKRLDYFLKQHLIWDRFTSDVYTVKVGSFEFYIPAGVYIYAGSWDGITDWIPIEELIDRDITIFTMDEGMGDWRLENLDLESVTEQSFYIPTTKNPLPIGTINGKRVILISLVDQYHKFKDQPPNIFFAEC